MINSSFYFKQIITSDYPLSSMTPSFAWSDMTEANLDDHQQKQEYFDENDPHIIPFIRRQKQFHKDVQTTNLNNGCLNNPNLLHLRNKYNPHEHHMLSNTFQVEDFQANNLDTLYSSERFLQTPNLTTESAVHSSNQVDLIDIIGASQRYRTNEL